MNNFKIICEKGIPQFVDEALKSHSELGMQFLIDLTNEGNLKVTCSPNKELIISMLGITPVSINIKGIFDVFNRYHLLKKPNLKNILFVFNEDTAEEYAYKADVIKHKYPDNSLCVFLECNDPDEEEFFGDEEILTVNLPHALHINNKICQYVDTNHFSNAGKWLEENHIAYPMGELYDTKSGYCTYSYYAFNI